MIRPLDVNMARFREEDEDHISGVDDSLKRTTKAIQNYTASPTPTFHCIEHVKDGVPLTAVGARLLGVPWRG